VDIFTGLPFYNRLIEKYFCGNFLIKSKIWNKNNLEFYKRYFTSPPQEVKPICSNPISVPWGCLINRDFGKKCLKYSGTYARYISNIRFSRGNIH